jgi:hypothetical protein
MQGCRIYQQARDGVEGSCDPVEFTLDRNNVSLLIESVDQRDGKLVGNGIHGEKVIMA